MKSFPTYSRLAMTLSVLMTLAAGMSSTKSLEMVTATHAASVAQDDSHFFPETHHTVSGKFWQYWQAHGGLAQQGYPISEQVEEKSEVDGKTYTVQYFERAVFELHPEQQPPYDVLLSLLGSLLYQQKYPNGAAGQSIDSAAGAEKFPETGKTVGGLFLDYWNSHGGLAQQGFPISEEFTEVSALDGKPYTVQYFERAVFEYHPEQQPPYNVLLSQLGTFRYQAHYGAQAGGATGGVSDLFSQGVAAYNAGNYDAAIAAFGQAIQASSEFEAAYIDRGIAYAAKGDSASALKDLDQAVAIEPQDGTPFYAAGIILYAKGDYAGAIDSFTNLAQANASDVRSYYWRANAYLGQGDPGNAQDDFSRAARLDSNSDLGKQAQAALDRLNNGDTPDPADPPALDLVQGQAPAPAPIPAPTQPPGGSQLLADSGFRPQTDGFQFENYIGSPNISDLTPDDLRRMFGDQVCANLANGCTLTPAAKQWMDTTNADMDQGHCEGFAALSAVFFQQSESPTQFGGATTHDLTLDGNTALQREIAYFWATQTTQPTTDSSITADTPAQILDILINTFKAEPNPPKTYTMEIYQPGFKEGHAITPYAVQDLGNGQYAVMVYDNNFHDLERQVIIDRNANTWSYNGSTNPNEPDSLYQGDADTKTLFITPTDPRLQRQVCDFCTGNQQVSGLNSTEDSISIDQATQQYNQIFLDGNANLLITDAQGRRTGYVSDTQFVNEIPGVVIKPITSANLWHQDLEPVYAVPTGIRFSLAVENPDPKNDSLSTVTMIGPGYDLSVQDLVLEPNTADHIDFSPDGKTIVYKTDYSDSPDMVLGTTGADADFSFDLKGVDLANQGTVTTHLDTDNGRLVLDARDNTEVTTYSLTMDRIDAQSEQIFGHDNIQLLPGDTAYLDYARWAGNGTPLLLEIDHGSDGTVDSTLQLSDVH